MGNNSNFQKNQPTYRFDGKLDTEWKYGNDNCCDNGTLKTNSPLAALGNCFHEELLPFVNLGDFPTFQRVAVVKITNKPT